MHSLTVRRVELAVRYARAGGHALHVTRPNHRTVAHAVAMFQRARQNVGNDFHVAMRVRGKTLTGRDPVFVDDAQTAPVHVRRIVILIERESVIRIEPPMIKVAAIFGFANSDPSWSAGILPAVRRRPACRSIRSIICGISSSVKIGKSSRPRSTVSRARHSSNRDRAVALSQSSMVER